MDEKEKIINSFDPNEPGNINAGIYSLPFNAAQSEIVLIPVPWEVTVSYGEGTGKGPEAIFEASLQMDLCHYDYPELWKKGIFMDEIDVELENLGKATKSKAAKIIQALEEGFDPQQDAELKAYYGAVQEACETMNKWVAERSAFWLKQNKIVGLIGGEHSVPFGYLKTLADQHSEFGILTIDAHLDLRNAYEGFEYSHASIFYNALSKIKQVQKITHVGIRDYGAIELDFAEKNNDKVEIHFEREMRRAQMQGENRKDQYLEIIKGLPQKVYVSFDIDGLDPKLCPHTGTPVPGGMEFEEAAYLLHLLKESGKEVIGFDLCEVAPGENDWDGNVGARMLYQLCGLAAS